MSAVKREQIIKWVVDEDMIYISPTRAFTEKKLKLIANILKCIGLVSALLIAAKLTFVDDLFRTFGMVIGFAIYLYGVQINKIVREATAEIKKRQAELSKLMNK